MGGGSRQRGARDLSIARYPLALVERDGSEEDAGPLVRNMQERIAVMFATWASAMAGSGRLEELRLALASVPGEERARIAAASVVPSAAKQTVAHQPREGETDSRRNRLL